ncbi:MAG: GNAT family N-acetyltransferase [Lachnospiraceae bacterium]|jgi:GNAT superfamily N-acetyltransferase|nr:GNAT family N-acetyltransferase [Lachnospiraceae bacterium]
MYNKDQIRMEWKRQLAIDFNCTIEDFDKKENVITIAKSNQGRRIYTQQKEFFSMVTLGGNAIISADEKMHPWLRRWVADKNGIWLFEHNHLMELEMELQKYGKKLGQSHHMFLPKGECNEPTINFALQWFEQDAIMNLYGQEAFSNALCEKFLPQRPDILAVGAMQGEKIIGMAGCSADTALFWQIGIDVLPAYRGMGIGTKLVQLLKNETFRRGAIPFYGTSLSNLHSWNIAINCGFYPAWVEIETVEK